MKPIAAVSAAVLLLASGEATAQTPEIRAGQAISGRIDRNERLPDSDRSGDCYRFTLDGPSEITVTMRSRAFDTYVYVFENGDCEGEARHEDDDGDGEDGDNSMLFRWVEAPGVYSIGASAFENRDRGDYTLALSVVPDPPGVGSVQASGTSLDAQTVMDAMQTWVQSRQTPDLDLGYGNEIACLHKRGSDGLTILRYYNLAGTFERSGHVEVDGRPVLIEDAGFSVASSRDWFINREAIPFGGREYETYGLPRVLGTDEVALVGEYDGVGLFAATGDTDPYVLYVISTPQNCHFQPYARR